MDWALQGLLRCFPPDEADSQGPGHLVGPVGPSLHAQGGSECPARPSPSSYILPALRFPMKMQLPALGMKPLSPPAAAAAPGSQRGGGVDRGQEEFSLLTPRSTDRSLPPSLSLHPPL